MVRSDLRSGFAGLAGTAEGVPLTVALTIVSAATAIADFDASSQIAMPKSACDAVYATTGYEQSVTNLAGVSLATDMVFRDGASLELATMTGDAVRGYAAALTVAV